MSGAIVRGLWLWACVLGPPALAAPEQAEPPTISEGQVRQEVLPALQARLARAEARSADAIRYFSGELALESAFPSLAGAPRLDPSFIRASSAV